jgi:hypothetical protein
MRLSIYQLYSNDKIKSKKAFLNQIIKEGFCPPLECTSECKICDLHFRLVGCRFNSVPEMVVWIKENYSKFLEDESPQLEFDIF